MGTFLNFFRALGDMAAAFTGTYSNRVQRRSTATMRTGRMVGDMKAIARGTYGKRLLRRAGWRSIRRWR
jgi:hypothetical protein